MHYFLVLKTRFIADSYSLNSWFYNFGHFLTGFVLFLLQKGRPNHPINWAKWELGLCSTRHVNGVLEKLDAS